MGLEDIIGGVVGARQRQGRVQQGSGINRVLLLLLAAGAAKIFMDRRNAAPAGSAAQPTARPGQASQGGGLSDILGGVLGGGAGGGLGGILGSVLGGGRGGNQTGGGMGGLGGLLTGAGGMGGLGALVEQFQRNGREQHVQSWVSTGPNPPASPEELEQALGADTVDDLAHQSGMDRQQMLRELSETLPDAVDQLTPDGTLPPPERLQLPPSAL